MVTVFLRGPGGGEGYVALSVSLSPSSSNHYILCRCTHTNLFLSLVNNRVIT